MAGVLLGALLAAGCSSNATTAVPFQSDTDKTLAQSKIVAVFADSATQLQLRIREAQQAGLTPRYVTVAAKSNKYQYSVYSQLLRTNHALLVRSYGRVFVYPLAGTIVTYSGSTPAVNVQQLPLVQDSYFDKLVQAGKVPGVFQYGNVAAKQALCADCVAVVGQRNRLRNLVRSWNKYKDPWQVSPDYVAWAPTPKTVTAASGPCGSFSAPSSPIPRRQATEPPGYSGYGGGTGTSSSGTKRLIVTNGNRAMSAGCSGLSVPSFHSGPSTVGSNPKPSPDPNSCAKTGDKNWDALMAKDPHLAQIMRLLSNLGDKPTITEDSSTSPTLPQGTAATTSGKNITWNQNNVTQAVANGQDAGQIAYHEDTHIYFEQTGINWGTATSATGTVDGYTVTYDLTTANGKDGYEHLLVHDAMQSAYGTDNTGAILSAFGLVSDGKGGLVDGAGVTVKSGTTAVTDAKSRQSDANGERGKQMSGNISAKSDLASALTNNSKCPTTTTAIIPRPPISGSFSGVTRPTLTPRPTATPVPTAAPTTHPTATPTPAHTPFNGQYWSGEIYGNANS